MRGLDTALQAFYSLLLNRMRTLLTVVGLSVGVGAIIAIGSIGYASLDEVQQELNRFGVDRLWVSTSGEDPLSLADVSLLDRQLPGGSFCPMLYEARRPPPRNAPRAWKLSEPPKPMRKSKTFKCKAAGFFARRTRIGGCAWR